MFSLMGDGDSIHTKRYQWEDGDSTSTLLFPSGDMGTPLMLSSSREGRCL